jgi:hypothetical protein
MMHGTRNPGPTGTMWASSNSLPNELFPEPYCAWWFLAPKQPAVGPAREPLSRPGNR